MLVMTCDSSVAADDNTWRGRQEVSQWIRWGVRWYLQDVQSLSGVVVRGIKLSGQVGGQKVRPRGRQGNESSVA